MSDKPWIYRSRTKAQLKLGDVAVQFRAREGEQVLSATVVDGCFLVGTDRRVIEWSSEKGFRTLAHAEDRDG